MSFKLTLLILSVFLADKISATGRFSRAVNSTFTTTTTTTTIGSSYNTTSDVAYDENTNESSGDYEGSGSGDEASGQNDTVPLLFDTSNEVSQSVITQSINLTDSDADTLIIKVHLPSRNVDSLLTDLQDDANNETDLSTNLDMAVSITGMLNSLLARIQGSSSTQE